MPKKVLITGASSGIGAASARKFIESGSTVLALARRDDKLQELRKQLGDAFKPVALDINDKAAVEKFFIDNKSDLSDLDLVVNNAGLALGQEGFQDSNLEDVETMIETNVTSLLRVSYHCIKVFKENKKGHIINLGSVAGITPYAGGTVYCATKAAVHMLSDALRMDLGGTNIRVSIVAPGRVAETEFSQVRYKGDEQKAKSVYEGYRIMTSSDVADTIHWIASRPEHLNIQEVVMLPTDQPSATTLAPFKK